MGVPHKEAMAHLVAKLKVPPPRLVNAYCFKVLEMRLEGKHSAHLGVI